MLVTIDDGERELCWVQFQRTDLRRLDVDVVTVPIHTTLAE